MKKRVVCYGDSNTWGYAPSGERYDETARWTSVMADKLGDRYAVIEEGLSGRTTAFEDPIEEYRNGKSYIMPCLLTNMPIDLIIVMLGSNDLKRLFGLTAFLIAKGMELLCGKILKSECGINGQPPKLLIASPIHVGDNLKDTDTIEYLDVSAIEESRKLSKYYQIIADELGCAFLDAAAFASPSRQDALHMTEQEHLKLADAMAEKVRRILD